MAVSTKANGETNVDDVEDRRLRFPRSIQEVGPWLDESKRRTALWATMTSIVAGLVVLGLGYLLLHDYRDAYLTVQFATNDARLDARVAGEAMGLEAFDLGLRQAQVAQVRGFAFAVVWGLVGAGLFATFWRHCWNVGPASKPIVLKFIAAIPLSGLAVATVEKVLTYFALQGSASDVSLRENFGPFIVSLAWAKWVLGGATLLAVVAMLVAALTRAVQRRPKKQENYVSTVVPPRPSRGTGVSCSGGGIRAASFSLGCLSALERWPATGTTAIPDLRMDPDPETAKNIKLADSVLGRANYLSSVSGGGYAASAWRIAVGTEKQRDRFDKMPPIIGDPFELDLKPTGAPRNLLEHVRLHRSFLATGRGGLPLAAIRFAVQTAFHIALLLSFVLMLAWPFGILLRSWAVGALEIFDGQDGPDLRFNFASHQWIPPLIWSGAAAIPCLVRLTTKRGRFRNAIDAASTFFLLLAVGSAFVLIALPWLVVHVSLFPEGGLDQLQTTGIYATALAAIWQFAKRYLQRQAKYLGGVLLAAGVALFALQVIEEAALEAPGLGRLRTWIVVSIAVVLAFLFANPDKWSLSDFYRKRLAGTFVSKLDDEYRPSVLDEGDAPPLSDYLGAPGPAPIICCAAARSEEAETGVAALSMTFEPTRVALHGWSEEARATKTTEQWLTHVEYKQRVPHGKQGKRLGSLIGAAAISGAAVAPSMGRLNLKTTNALLAALNARLGVWVPNPAFETDDRMAAPRVINMFKEIFGVYGPTDPNVYATDGGHWENLGLVELIRKKCDTIISIDTSGDMPGTYQAFKNAIDLAFLECAAKVEIDEAEWEAMVPDEDGLVPRNFVRGTIHYADDTQGELLYVKATVSRSTPLAVRRYAAGDRTFPNYSTANQMLTDAQLTNLFKLGFASMQTALEARGRYIATTAARAPRDASHAGA